MSTASAMYDFKKFLFETEGECLYLFWMDVEHLKCHRSQFYTRKLVIRISHAYIIDGSPFQLNSTLREGLMAVQKFDAPRNCWDTKQQVKELVRCQARVLATLREYWCHRYVLKNKEQRRGGGRLPLRKHWLTKRAGSSQKMVRSSVNVGETTDGKSDREDPINKEARGVNHRPPAKPQLTRRISSARKSSVAGRKSRKYEFTTRRTSSAGKIKHARGSINREKGEDKSQASLVQRSSYGEGKSTLSPVRMSQSSSRASSVWKLVRDPTEKDEEPDKTQQRSFDKGPPPRMSRSSSRACSVQKVVHSFTKEESDSKGFFDKGESMLPLKMSQSSDTATWAQKVVHSSIDRKREGIGHMTKQGTCEGRNTTPLGMSRSSSRASSVLKRMPQSQPSSRTGLVESELPEVHSTSRTGSGDERDHLPSVTSRDSMPCDGAGRAPHIKISSSKIPYLFSGEKDVVTHAVSNDALAKMTILSCSKPKTLLSSSAYSLFSRSSSSIPQAEVGQDKSDSVLLVPFLCATMRADFIAGNPFLRYLKESKAHPVIANYLFFWQSVENILSQDEMQRWYNVWRNVKKEGKEDGRPSPYLSYFEPHLVAKNLQELCTYFLQSRSIHRVELPQDMAEGLSLLLPKGLGQGLLLAAQEYVVKVRNYGTEDMATKSQEDLAL